MKSYDNLVARLGDGKWHIVRGYSDSDVFTACAVRLVDATMGMKLERTTGNPTCAHCLRWWKAHGR